MVLANLRRWLSSLELFIGGAGQWLTLVVCAAFSVVACAATMTVMSEGSVAAIFC
jgi:hypothetical protein